MPTEPQIPKWICNESHPRTENEPPQKDLVIEARELLANAAHGPLTLIRYEHGGGRLYREEPRDLVADFYDAANRELYYRAPGLLRQLADEVERLRELVRHMQFPQGG